MARDIEHTNINWNGKEDININYTLEHRNLPTGKNDAKNEMLKAAKRRT